MLGAVPIVSRQGNIRPGPQSSQQRGPWARPREGEEQDSLLRLCFFLIKKISPAHHQRSS